MHTHTHMHTRAVDTVWTGQDLHSEAAVEGLRRAASCVVQLGPLTDLQQRLAAAALEGSGRAQQLGGGALAGRLDCRTRRRTGA